MNELETNFEDKEFEWYESEEPELTEDVSFTEYDISSSPNDFNIKTLNDFIDSGIVMIPGFQRNYVWDIRKASKLIESIIIGIPIPQIFLFEEAKNKFIVIDGQQRYMTIFYFMKKRFPRKEKRLELRKIFDEHKSIPEDILNDNTYFVDFNLKLPTTQPNQINKFNNLNYFTLDEEDRITFDLRTIRNIIIKQSSPDDGNSVVFEIFNRLNTGGVNLKPQEIRTSLFHSDFYEMLYKLNLWNEWRSFTPTKTPNLHMKDIEILLRGFAMLIDYKDYKPSMTRFLNKFSFTAKAFPKENIDYLVSLFKKFVNELPNEDPRLFYSKTGRFNISVFESIFVASCEVAFESKNLDITPPTIEQVNQLKEDTDFITATQSDTASIKNVTARIEKAKEILL